MKKTDSGNSSSVIGVLLLSIPIIVAIVYFKIAAADAPMEKDEEINSSGDMIIAVPDTSVATDAILEVADTSTVYKEIGVDTRPAMEAGDEDGYWDGWYDGVETGERTRYDETSSFSSQADKDSYAASYREGYEKGFSEAKKNKQE